MSVLVDGLAADELARRCGAPSVHVFDAVGSTMDEAHRLAEAGASSGTLAIAERQFSGRGRFGRRWISDPGRGLWTTTIVRDVDPGALDALSIRIGVALAPALDRFADGRVMLKWPNDLFVGGRKLGGILVETRWREARVEWVAVGVGINLVPPADQQAATGLRAGVTRSELLRVVAPAVRGACAATGLLTSAELGEYTARDSLRDSRLVEPAAGVARGITPTGALVVEIDGAREYFRRGSPVVHPEAG